MYMALMRSFCEGSLQKKITAGAHASMGSFGLQKCKQECLPNAIEAVCATLISGYHSFLECAIKFWLGACGTT